MVETSDYRLFLFAKLAICKLALKFDIVEGEETSYERAASSMIISLSLN